MATIMSAIYGGGPFYAGSDVLQTLSQTGFTTMVCWCIHVSSTGDLAYNDTPLCSNGQYMGDAGWGAQLQAVKTGGSVNRILFSVGSGGSSDYTNIMNLINADGTGTGSILYRNFAALLAAIPAIDGIDMDDEDNYDQDTIVQFGQMLAAIGYGQVTFCPYTLPSFWNGCLAALNQSNPGLVTGYNLQCYSGGAYNLYDVPDWIAGVQNVMGEGFNAAAFVNPGLWCANGNACSYGMGPATMQNYYSGWAADGVTGGFVWLYDDMMKCGNNPAAYAAAVNSGLQQNRYQQA